VSKYDKPEVCRSEFTKPEVCRSQFDKLYVFHSNIWLNSIYSALSGENMYINRPHTPAHLFLDNHPYFITGAIKYKRCLLKPQEIKFNLLDDFRKYLHLYQWELHHWVVLDNHYHLLVQSAQGKDLPKLMRSVHSRVAKIIIQITGCQKPVWWNYWDYCPRNKQDYYVRLNYLLNNPVKHGYVSDLYDYPYSSVYKIVDESINKQIQQQFIKYPGFKYLEIREAYDDDF
jgi:putative transposase